MLIVAAMNFYNITRYYNTFVQKESVGSLAKDMENDCFQQKYRQLFVKPW